VVNQSAVVRLAGAERLLQGIQNKVCLHVATDPPAHDEPREHIDNKGHIRKPLPGRDKGKVSHPELVGALCGEVAVDPIQRVRGCGVRPGGPYPSATHFALEPKVSHEALHGAAGHSDALPMQCPPYLLGPIDLTVGSPEALNRVLRDSSLLVLSGRS
jgi:hypothetical protein